MSPYSNLVSDSTLVQDTIDLLNTSGGRAAATEIVDAVFKLSHIDDELAGLLVADLVRNDRRFKISDNTVELLADDTDSRLLRDLEFVVVDVEATGAKTPPTSAAASRYDSIARGKSWMRCELGQAEKSAGLLVFMICANMPVTRRSESRLISVEDGPCCSTTHSQSRFAISRRAVPSYQ